MKMLGLRLLILFLEAVRLPWTICRHFRRVLIFKHVRIYRAAYQYAFWIESRSTVKNAKVTLNTHAGVLTYERPLTMRKIVEAYRGR